MTVGGDSSARILSRRPDGAAASDQASRLRLMVAQQSPKAGMYTVTVNRPPASAHSVAAGRPRTARRARIVAVTSGKGGVGKSSIAVNLAVALAQHKVRVTLLDADLGLANADVLCGISPTTRLDSIVGPPARRRSMRQIAVPAPGGFRLVPGSVGLARMANLPAGERDEILDAISELEQDSDLVLIDTGAGVGDGVTSFVRFADAAVVVVTPEPTSIADAYAMMKLLRTTPALFGEQPPRLMLAVNQVESEEEARAVHARITATCRKFLGFEPQLAGWVHRDAACVKAVRARGPFLMTHPKCKAAKDLHYLARALAHELSLKFTAKAIDAGAGFWSFLRRS